MPAHRAVAYKSAYKYLKIMIERVVSKDQYYCKDQHGSPKNKSSFFFG